MRELGDLDVESETGDVGEQVGFAVEALDVQALQGCVRERRSHDVGRTASDRSDRSGERRCVEIELTASPVAGEVDQAAESAGRAIVELDDDDRRVLADGVKGAERNQAVTTEPPDEGVDRDGEVVQERRVSPLGEPPPRWCRGGLAERVGHVDDRQAQ